MNLLLRWIAAAAAVGIAAWFVPGIEVRGGIPALFGIALILGLVNALVRPLLRWLSCGLIVFTLGLFLLVINAAMLLLAAWIAREIGIGFHVRGIVPAVIGSVVISVATYVLSLLLPDGD